MWTRESPVGLYYTVALVWLLMKEVRGTSELLSTYWTLKYCMSLQCNCCFPGAVQVTTREGERWRLNWD